MVMSRTGNLAPVYRMLEGGGRYPTVFGAIPRIWFVWPLAAGDDAAPDQECKDRSKRVRARGDLQVHQLV